MGIATHLFFRADTYLWLTYFWHFSLSWYFQSCRVYFPFHIQYWDSLRRFWNTAINMRVSRGAKTPPTGPEQVQVGHSSKAARIYLQGKTKKYQNCLKHSDKNNSYIVYYLVYVWYVTKSNLTPLCNIYHTLKSICCPVSFFAL